MASAIASTSQAALRSVLQEDIPFIVNSWVESYIKHASAPRHIYVPEQHAVAMRTLTGKDARVIVACNPDDPDQIVGYAVFSLAHTNTDRLDPRPVYHYVYVKSLFRRMQVARQLIHASAAIHGSDRAWASHQSRHLAALFAPIAIEYNEFTRR
jgi:hypothetical protein